MLIYMYITDDSKILHQHVLGDTYDSCTCPDLQNQWPSSAMMLLPAATEVTSTMGSVYGNSV